MIININHILLLIIDGTVPPESHPPPLPPVNSTGIKKSVSFTVGGIHNIILSIAKLIRILLCAYHIYIYI